MTESNENQKPAGLSLGEIRPLSSLHSFCTSSSFAGVGAAGAQLLAQLLEESSLRDRASMGGPYLWGTLPLFF